MTVPEYYDEIYGLVFYHRTATMINEAKETK